MEAAGDTRRSDQNQEDVSSKRSMVANNLEDKTSARESLNVDNKKNNSEHGQSRYGSKNYVKKLWKKCLSMSIFSCVSLFFLQFYPKICGADMWS
ncbi:hypothetical protein JTB14_026109 [Gonioctena quinquepunctata]|nr:hypothetical protein JTB14_026109 [Gonioctena quinquepunctata]